MRSVKQERSTSQFSQECCSVFSCPSEFVLPRKLDKTGLHEKTSPFSAFLELRNSLSREQTRRIMRETQVQPLNNNEVTRCRAGVTTLGPGGPVSCRV